MKQQLDDVMSKEVTRKEFLMAVGFGAASVLGLSGVMKFVLNQGSGLSKQKVSGFGSGAYGGTQKG